MDRLDRGRWLFVPLGLALVALGVRTGLEKPWNGDSYCGQVLWNGDLRQCPQLGGKAWWTGLLVAAGLACFALATSRRLVASLVLTGVAFLGVGTLRAFESPVAEEYSRTCGSVAGNGPGNRQGDPPIGRISLEADCESALQDQRALILAFLVPGALVIVASRPFVDAWQQRDQRRRASLLDDWDESDTRPVVLAGGALVAAVTSFWLGGLPHPLVVPAVAGLAGVALLIRAERSLPQRANRSTGGAWRP